jgi:hypothetical protein
MCTRQLKLWITTDNKLKHLRNYYGVNSFHQIDDTALMMENLGIDSICMKDA